jgi:Mce-associated membrane protein
MLSGLVSECGMVGSITKIENVILTARSTNTDRTGGRMPPRKRPSLVLNGDADDLPREADRVTSPDDALAAAEEADAEAAEAEAVAAAARARARAIRLRREAATAAAAAEAESKAKELESTAVEVSATPELEGPTSGAEVTEASEPVRLTTAPVDDPSKDYDSAADEDAGLDDQLDELDELDRQPSPAPWKMIAKALVATVALVGSIALLGLSGAMFWHHRNVEAQQAKTAEFAAAARQGVVTLMSLDFKKAKEDVDAIIDNTTGEFKKDFQGQADSFIKVAQNSQVVTEATVNSAAVQSMTNDQATVLVAVTTNVSNKASNKQDPRSWRLRVGMARDGDRIKLSKVEFVP